MPKNISQEDCRDDHVAEPMKPLARVIAYAKIFFPYSLLLGIGLAIAISNFRSTDDPVDATPAASMPGMEASAAVSAAKDQAVEDDGAARDLDPVCHMKVTSAWGFEARYQDRSYYFCTRRCRDLFAATPEKYLGDRCAVCNQRIDRAQAARATYMGKTYYLCSDAHRLAFKADPAAYFMHSMWGVPSWMYYMSIGVVLVVSFGLFEWTDRPSRWPLGPQSRAVAARAGAAVLGSGHDRIDLLQSRVIRFMVTSRKFRFACQAIFVAMFFLIIAAGLFGNQNPALNIAPLLTWTVWWGGLVLLIMFAGKAWCYVCPWDAVAGWMEKLRFWTKTDQGLGLELKWPRAIRNILIATLLFVGLTWVELGFGVTIKPRVTAYLAIAMLLMAIVSAFLFERKGFCRYACLVGRVSGLYAMFSGVEIRTKDGAVCRNCAGKECVRGTEHAYGCPTFLFPATLSENTYCIQCTECIQACSHDNLALNLRPWSADLVTAHRARTDEAYLALLMLAITSFHGFSMTPNWARLIGWLNESFSLGRVVAFSVGMAALMLAPIIVYALLVAISHQWAARRLAGRTPSYRDYFIRYAYALLPIALFYHLAHNLEHLLMEGPKSLALISDPFGWGWNLFGTLDWHIPPLVSLDVLWGLQIVLVLVGHVYSLWVAQRTSVHMFTDRKAAFRSQLPMLFGMIAFSALSLWLLKQPMEMRTSAM